ncbi:MAG: hypothetical protein FJX20_20860 [Alphaproteobacteria bacterium]|nr:hypothetical protein [Alphaproteobacteria bacterium]
MGKTYVFGFEGTGMGIISTENWRLNATLRKQSFVSQCFDRAVGGAVKHYGLSPDVGGFSCDDILREAIRVFEANCPGITRRVEYEAPEAMPRTGRGGARVERWTYTPGPEGPPVVFVFGYSRGGFIAMCFCEYLRRLGIQVRYLGLFDAVDRDISMDARYNVSDIPPNVLTCRHAIRDPKIGSRPLFGNTGTWMDPARDHKLKDFPGTHSAMGGFPLDTPELDPALSSRIAAGGGLLYVDPNQETAAARDVASFVGGPAVQLGGLASALVAIPPSRALVDRANRLLQERDARQRALRDAAVRDPLPPAYAWRRPLY